MSLILFALQAATVRAPVRETVHFAITPTAAVRALSMQGVTPPAAAVTFTFVCSVLPNLAPANCIDTATEANTESREALSRAAKIRTDFYRLAPNNYRQDSTRTVLVREIVSAADVGPVDAAVDTVEVSQLRFSEGTTFDPKTFYPVAALRTRSQSRVAVTCRVLADQSLLCRNPQTDLPGLADPPPAWRQPSLDADFGLATILAFATMRVSPELADGRASVGHEARLRMRWVLPD